MLSTPDRRGSDSNKWKKYPAEVLPLWVADMDYAADPSIITAVQERLAHPVLGYGSANDDLRDGLCQAIKRDYDWDIAPEWLVFLPGVEPGFNMALHAFTRPGDGMVQEMPVYAPLQAAARFWQLDHHKVWQQIGTNGRWETDVPAFEAAAAKSKVMLLCNPQNPTGRVYTREDLAWRAELAIRHDLLVVSDEIHCGLTLDGRRHIPIASLSPSIAGRSITLMAASKTWNIAGLKAAFAIVPDADIRTRFMNARLGMVDSVNILGLAAMGAAYQATAWREAIRVQMAANRDLLAALVSEHLPLARMIPAQAGFLAWIDFSAYEFIEKPAEFFLASAKVGLSEGSDFGEGLQHWVRLNYGCSPEILRDAILRMAAAMSGQSATGCRIRDKNA